MCIILDNNISGEVFGGKRSEASEAVWRWINGIEGEDKWLRVVIGGKLTSELKKNSRVREWLIRGMRRGNIINYGSKVVDLKESEVRNWDLRSDDPHIIALALESDARLLYTNDLLLQKDFTNVKFINKPQGKVYTTVMYSKYDKVKEKLLKECRCVVKKRGEV